MKLFFKKSALVYNRIGGEAISFNESAPACGGSGGGAAEGGKNEVMMRQESTSYDT